VAKAFRLPDLDPDLTRAQRVRRAHDAMLAAGKIPEPVLLNLDDRDLDAIFHYYAGDHPNAFS
jgi:hypothetical protein